MNALRSTASAAPLALTCVSAAEAEPSYSHDELQDACKYFTKAALEEVLAQPARDFTFDEFLVGAGIALGRYKDAGWVNARAEIGSFEVDPFGLLQVGVFKPTSEIRFGAVCHFDLVERRVLSIDFLDAENRSTTPLNPKLADGSVRGMKETSVITGDQVRRGKF